MRDLAYDDIDMDDEVWGSISTLKPAELREILRQQTARLTKFETTAKFLAGQNENLILVTTGDGRRNIAKAGRLRAAFHRRWAELQEDVSALQSYLDRLGARPHGGS